MRRVLGYTAMATAMLVPVCHGQGLLDQVNFGNAGLGGLHVYRISVFSGYSSSAYPLISGQALSIGAGDLGSDVNYGARVTLGWQHRAERTSMSFRYSGTYDGMARYSNLNAFNHSLSLSASRRVGRKWTVNLSGSAEDSTFAQFLYQPARLSVVSQAPDTFDDLAAALSVGQFSNDQIASMLTGAPVLESPARSLLLGSRILSYAVQTSLNYAHSPRLNFHVSSFAAGGQHGTENRLDSQSQNGFAQQNYVMPRSLGGSGGMGLSYSLSPRTQVGVDVEENRVLNRSPSSYGTTATASLGRKMGRRWLLRVYGGPSVLQVATQSFQPQNTRQTVGGGSLAYRTYGHTFVGSYDRSSFDTYGFAVGANTTVMGSWTWRRPGNRWQVFATFGQQQLRNTGFASISGWQASGGWSESLNARTILTAQYVYLSSAGNYLGNFNSLAVHSIRVSLGWTPQGMLR